MADRCGNTSMYAGTCKIHFDRDEPTVLRDGVRVPVSGKRVPEGEVGVNRHDLQDGEIITLGDGTRVRYDADAALGRAGRNATTGLLVTSSESHLLTELGAPETDITARAAGYHLLLRNLGQDELRERVLAGARAAHGKWAEDFVAGLGADEERVRWKDDGAGGQVDILNTPFDDLPRKWQEENLAQTISAMAAVAAVPADVTEPTEIIELGAATVHEQWLQRNSWVEDPLLTVAYAELSEVEKEKDRVFARAALARSGRLPGDPEVLARTLDQLGEVGGTWSHRERQGLLDPQGGFSEAGYAAASLLPSSEKMDRYYADTDAKHFPLSEEGRRQPEKQAGSLFTEEKNLPELLTATYAQRPLGLAGDDRWALIDQGVPAEALLPQCRYLQVWAPGTNGLVRLDELPGDTPVRFIRTKEGAPCSAVVEVAASPAVNVATIIIGPDQEDPTRECVWTAHPGLPVRLDTSDREPGETTVAALRAEDPDRLWVQAHQSPSPTPPPAAVAATAYEAEQARKRELADDVRRVRFEMGVDVAAQDAAAARYEAEAAERREARTRRREAHEAEQASSAAATLAAAYEDTYKVGRDQALGELPHTARELWDRDVQEFGEITTRAEDAIALSVGLAEAGVAAHDLSAARRLSPEAADALVRQHRARARELIDGVEEDEAYREMDRRERYDE